MFHQRVPLQSNGMTQIHEQVVLMDQSAAVHVLILTRTRVALDVKPGVVNVVINVADLYVVCLSLPLYVCTSCGECESPFGEVMCRKKCYFRKNNYNKVSLADSTVLIN